MVPTNIIGRRAVALGRLWGLKLIKYFGSPLRKRIQDYKYKISYESEYLFRMRKEVATSNKFKKLTNTTNIINSTKLT
jgi:hypothetical protein